jgi:hypothetical protein
VIVDYGWGVPGPGASDSSVTEGRPDSTTAGPIRRRRLFTLYATTVQYSDFIQTALKCRWMPEKKRDFIRWHVIVVRYAVTPPHGLGALLRMASTMLYKRTWDLGLQPIYNWQRWQKRVSAGLGF